MGISQMLVYSHMTFFEKQDRLTLQEGAVIAQFESLRKDVLHLSLGAYFAEVVEAVTHEGLEQNEILSLILNAMYALDTLKKPPNLVKAAFELSLMGHCGYEPMLDHCAICGCDEPVDARLHLQGGTLHCAKCAGGSLGGISMPVSPVVLKVMRHILWGDGQKLFSFVVDDATLLSLGDVSQAFLLTQLERGFRTLDFYKQMERMEGGLIP